MYDHGIVKIVILETATEIANLLRSDPCILLIHFLSFTMLIEERQLQHWIDNFYGYGSWQAGIWFIGYEEGGGDLPEEVAEKFNYFFAHHGSSSQPTLCDI